MELRLIVDGASDLDIQRGLEAATEAFQKAGIDSLDAAEGMFALEGWDVQGFPEGALDEQDSRAASAWIEAERAAIAACCADWPEEKPRKGSLGLNLTQEDKDRLYGADEGFDEEEESYYAVKLAELRASEGGAS